MSDRIWPVIRRRIATIIAFFGIAALFALVAVLLAWQPDTDYRTSVVFPADLSYSESSVLLVKVGNYDEPPPEDLEVTLLQVNGYDAAEAIVEGYQQVVSSQKGDSAGFATVPVPPIGAGIDEVKNADAITLVARVEAGGETSYFSKRYDLPAKTKLLMTLDRPLYQPGQTIDARILAVGPDDGKPVATKVVWEVRDPRQNLVKRTESTTSKMGISAFSFSLAAEGIQGIYEITATVGDVSRTETVEVRPYRLPRFSVDVRFDGALTSGESAQGRAVATYLYGEPVVGETVSVRIETAMQSVRVDGVTDERGTFVFELPPHVLTPGADVRASATVTSEAGRMVTADASARVRSAADANAFEVELVPSRRADFVMYEQNRGYVRVIQDGEPAAGVAVRLLLPEAKTERTVSVTTDADGLAEIVWEPHRSGLPVTAFVGAPQVEVTVNPPVGYHEGLRLEPRQVVVDAGDVVEADVIVPEGYDSRGHILLHKDGTPVATGTIDQDGVARITVPNNAHGLFWLQQIEESSYDLDESGRDIPIWVRQPGGRDVEIAFDREEYRPGEVGALKLSFPASAGAVQSSDVAFGVVGVDEALYELAERTDDSISFGMSESRSDIRQISAALANFPTDEAQSEAAQNVALARYLTALQRLDSDSFASGDHRNITDSVTRAERTMLRAAWVVFCMAIILVLVMFALRATTRSVRRRDFSFKRVGANLGIALASCVIAAIFVSVGGEEGFVGGLVVWLLVSLGWFIGAAWRIRDGHDSIVWIVYTLGGVWIWGCAALGSDEVLLSNGDFADVFIFVGTLLPLGLWALEALAWSFVFMRAKEWQAAVSMTSIFGLVAGAAFFSTTGMKSAAYEDREMLVASGPMEPGSARLYEEEAPMPKKARGASPAPAKPDERDAPRVRSWFPETMIWLAEVVADESGVASLPIEFPDSITTWRINAWANTSDGRFGVGQKRVRTIQEFFVEVELPTHLVSGDVAEVPVVLMNRGDEPVMVSVEARAEGALALGRRPPGQIVVAPGQRALVKTSVRAERAGEGAITVTASGDTEGGGDAVRRAVQVEPDGPSLTLQKSGIVRDGFDADLSIPFAALPGTSRLDVSIYPSILADALEGLESMLRQPNGCFEQTSSANYPNVLVLAALRRTAPDEWPGGADVHTKALQDAEEFAELGYQRMLSFQTNSGGFALYPDDDPDPMLTAYGLMQLAKMRDVVHVDPASGRKAVRWLEQIQNGNGSWPVWADRVSGGDWRSSADVGQVRSTSFIVIGLAPWRKELSDRSRIDRALDHIEARVGSVQAPDTLAYAATALALGGRPDAARSVIDRLASSATRDGDGAYFSTPATSWMGGRGGYANVETTAVAAWVMAETGAQPELLGPVLNYLAGARSRWGGWGTTQATAWTLRAFEKLRATDTGKVDLTIELDGEPMARTVTTDGAAGVATVGGDSPDLLHSFAEPGLATGESRLRVAPKGGQTTAMVHAVASYAVPWGSRTAAQRESGSLELDWRPTSRSYAFGKPVEVVATVNNPTSDWVANAIVELPIPPGAFVDVDEVRGRFEAARVELLPTHVRVYLDDIAPKSRAVFPYRFVPMVRGRFSMPPLRAYPFYTPLPMNEIDAGDVAVE